MTERLGYQAFVIFSLFGLATGVSKEMSGFSGRHRRKRGMVKKGVKLKGR